MSIWQVISTGRGRAAALPVLLLLSALTDALPTRRNGQWTVDTKSIAYECEYAPPFTDAYAGGPACVRYLATEAFYVPSPHLNTRRILFHLFWNGPFTEVMMLSLRSFLYTQVSPDDPQPVEMWVWLDPGGDDDTPPAFSQADLDAEGDIPFDVVSARSGVGGEPLPDFLNCGCIRFKLYSLPLLLSQLPHELLPSSLTAAAHVAEEPMYNVLWRLFTSARRSGDRAGSDVARFVLLYLYGGVYIDADVLFLRDFRPLQHFDWAYRWSLSPWCNTAVMHAARHSPILARTIRTALGKGMSNKEHRNPLGGGGGGGGASRRRGLAGARAEGRKQQEQEAEAEDGFGQGEKKGDKEKENSRITEAYAEAAAVAAAAPKPLHHITRGWSAAFHPRRVCFQANATTHVTSDRLMVFPAQLFDVAWLEWDNFMPGGWEGLPGYNTFLRQVKAGGPQPGATVHDFALGGVLAYHWHNQWKEPILPGTWAKVFSDAMDAFQRGTGPNIYGEKFDVKDVCAAAALAAGRGVE